LLLVRVVRIVAHHVGERMARQDRHAVVGLLAAEGDLVAGGLDLGLREFIVGELGLLDAEHVDRIGGQPLQQVGEADFQRIDVPGNYFHRCVRRGVSCELQGA
jgi:hypothetical protein